MTEQVCNTVMIPVEEYKALRKDAERWNWLLLKDEYECGWFKWSRVPNHMHKVKAAIDAAMRGEKK